MRPFRYTAPATVVEAIDALVASGPGTKFLAGGTNLYDLMRLEVETPAAVVDIHRLAVDREPGHHRGPCWGNTFSLRCDRRHDPSWPHRRMAPLLS